MRHSVGEGFTSRYSAYCPLCGQSWHKGDQISAYKVKPGKRNPSRLVGEYAHLECAKKYLDGKLPEDREAGPSPPAPAPAPVPAPKKPDGTIDSLLVSYLREIVKEEMIPLSKELAELAAKNGNSSTYKGIEVKVNDLPEVKLDGSFHDAFKDVLELVACNKPCLLVGPSGCGKSHLAKQIASALQCDYGFVSFTAGISEYHFFGRVLPVGENGRCEFVGTDFLRIYENGGLFLLDEIDGADPNTLLSLNAALANGHCSVPNRREKPIAERHPEFRCIATANTYGTGADFLFVGRNQLDDASIDRFRIGIVPIDYDVHLEESLCPDATIREDLWEIRNKVRDSKLRRTVSTRFLRQAYEMSVERGWKLPRIRKALTAGWSKEELSKVGIS